jgi:hypothetical protein
LQVFLDPPPIGMANAFQSDGFVYHGFVKAVLRKR